MQISPINNMQNSNTNFKRLVIHENTAKFIKQLHENDTALIKTWEEKLANTKHFDLAVYNKVFPVIVSKIYKGWAIEGKANVGQAIGSSLPVEFADAVDFGWLHFMDLEFATPERANIARNSLLKENNIYSSNDEINELGRAVNAVEVLEEAFDYRQARLAAKKAKHKQAETPNKVSFLDKVLEKFGLKRLTKSVEL